jgi:hypothetical protein
MTCVFRESGVNENFAESQVNINTIIFFFLYLVYKDGSAMAGNMFGDKTFYCS